MRCGFAVAVMVLGLTGATSAHAAADPVVLSQGVVGISKQVDGDGTMRLGLLDRTDAANPRWYEADGAILHVTQHDTTWAASATDADRDEWASVAPLGTDLWHTPGEQVTPDAAQPLLLSIDAGLGSAPATGDTRYLRVALDSATTPAPDAYMAAYLKSDPEQTGEGDGDTFGGEDDPDDGMKLPIWDSRRAAGDDQLLLQGLLTRPYYVAWAFSAPGRYCVTLTGNNHALSASDVHGDRRRRTGDRSDDLPAADGRRRRRRWRRRAGACGSVSGREGQDGGPHRPARDAARRPSGDERRRSRRRGRDQPRRPRLLRGPGHPSGAPGGVDGRAWPGDLGLRAER